MSVSDWSATADENTTVDGINISEHCPAKNMNDALRAVMAALKNKCDALDSTDNTLRLGAVIGEIRWFALPTPPEGWLVCNGATVYTSNYPALFAAIGDTFTPRLLSSDPDVANPEYGDPTVFRLPNLMGKVPWGSSTQIGTEMKAGLPEIAGAVGGVFVWGDSGVGAFLDSVKEGPADFTTYNPMSHQWHTLKFEASKANAIYGKSDTVQPPALCLLPCIRYE